MNKKDFYFIGKITKASGYKGDLMFFFDVDDIIPYKD
ncbi:MAG: 16S rRNA processing protein RimM, partial [Bacteroidetes bacterium]|nr:16S rRNA processing protein RimM [Bacteroidota bacterium]